MYIVTLINGSLETPIHNEKQKLYSGQIVKSINTIDTFTFCMLPNNPGFSITNEFTTLVTVYNTNKARYEFIGRVLHTETSMEEDGFISKTATCESVLGYLCDSQQTYKEEQNWTVSGLLQHLIDCHNSQVEEYKRFKIGTITAKDSNDNLYEGIQRENTWNAIKSKLIDKIGGELQYRITDDGIYLDYLEKIGTTKETPIAVSVNMKTIRREQDPTAYVTRLIPLGCKLTKDGEETEERLDITSANNGLNYIDDEAAVEVYGIHVGYAEWDDVTDANNLLRKARSWLEENNRVQIKYSISAYDLSLIGLAVEDFDVGNYHPVENGLIGIDDAARIIKKTIDIHDDTESAIEFGDNFKTLSDIQRDLAAQLKATEQGLSNLGSDSKDFRKQLENINKTISESRAFIGVVSTDVYYYLSSSNTELVGGAWLSDPPAWVDGWYYWQKVITVYTDESTTESEPVCITGASGVDGVGVSSITTQFYLSTNKTTQSGGKWVETMPQWSKGMYLWTRSVITYTDGTTKYTTPICDTAWEVVNDLEEEFTSKIEQLAESITLEISGSLGSNASIILSAGANKNSYELDLSQVRAAFANDPTAISISAGLITFNSNTLVVNSTNFKVTSSGIISAWGAYITGEIKANTGRIGGEGTGWTINSNSIYYGDSFDKATAFLCTGCPEELTIAGHTQSGWVLKAGSKFGVTSDGNMYCSDAYINGEITSTDAPYKTEIKNGSIRLFHDNVLRGTINTRYTYGNDHSGISLRVENDGSYIMFCSPDDSALGFQIDYYLNVNFSSNYNERHIFQTSASFLSDVFFRSRAYFWGMRIKEGTTVYMCDSDGDATYNVLHCNASNNIFGDSSIKTFVEGSSVSIENYVTSSDRNAKNSIEALPDEYETFVDYLEPVRFKYNNGTSGRYHVGYIAQDVEAALTSAGLTTSDFAGYVDDGSAAGLALRYTEFIAALHMKIKRLEQRIAALENN